MRYALLVAAICCVVIPVNGQKTTAKPNANQKASAKTQAPANSTINVDTVNVKKLNLTQQTNTSDKTEQNVNKSPSYFRRLIAPESLPNLILCIVGIAGVFVAVCTVKYIAAQARFMRHQNAILRHQTRANTRAAKAAESAAIEARRTTQIIIDKERARVHVEIGMFSLGHPNDPPNVSGVSYTVQCNGTTPASIVRTSVKIALKTLQNTPVCQSDAAMNMAAVLIPNDKGFERITNLAGVAGTDAQSRFMKGDLYAYCHGWIIYKDIFGSSWVYEFTYMRTHDSQWMGQGKESAYEDDEEDYNEPTD